MIIINEPIIVNKQNKLLLTTKFKIDMKEEELWFSFNPKYKDYLVTESCDSAIISLLLLAMKKGQDIHVNGKMSEKLYYQLNHYLINALNLYDEGFKKIKIYCEEINSSDINKYKAVGTGLSCGVDSFSVIYDHINDKNQFKVDYFTFFNAGSHGDFGGEKSRALFKERLELVKPYANEINKAIIDIDTNLNEILNMNHQKTHTIKDVAMILNLQKLFKYYYYASAYRFDNYKLDRSCIDTGSFDLLLLSMLSTESTTFYSGVSQFTRVERTKNISKYKPTYKYLNVCVASSSSGIAENCSVCPKCLRTQLTLDVLGKYDKYNNIFNKDKYFNVKDKYIGEVIAKKNHDIYSKEIYDLMIDKRYPISLKARYYGIRKKVIDIIKRTIS